MSKRRTYRRLPEIELPAELDAPAREMTRASDDEIEAVRVNFRWGRRQVELVKRVADHIGIPYQTYIKQVVYRQAVADLREADEAASAT